MYRWRAVAACARTVFPDVILGVYTPDEMGAENVNEAGELIAQPANIHKLPTKSQLVESVQPKPEANPLDTEIKTLAGKLNEAFATDVWTKGELTNHARLFFEEPTLKTWKDLSGENKQIFIGDLTATLNERLAIGDDGAIKAEVIENETTEAV